MNKDDYPPTAESSSAPVHDCSSERSPLYAFFRELVDEYWEWGAVDIDAAWLHETLLKHGLIKEVVFDSSVHSDPTCVCEDGDSWFVLSDLGKTDPTPKDTQ